MSNRSIGFAVGLFALFSAIGCCALLAAPIVGPLVSGAIVGLMSKDAAPTQTPEVVGGEQPGIRSGEPVEESVWAPEGLVWLKDWSFPHVPEGCEETGMCALNVSVPANGILVVTGAPLGFKAAGFDHTGYDASQRQANVAVLVNPTELTISVTLTGWSGANAVNAYSGEGSQPIAREVLIAAAEQALSFHVGLMTKPDNCGETGCALENMGYAVIACTANDNVEGSCEVVYHWDPVFNTPSIQAPNHTEIYGSP